MGITSHLRCGLLLIALASFSGCKRDEVQVYSVAKETPVTAPGQNAALPPGHPGAGNSLPRLTWVLPTGWEEAPAGEMRLASFRVKAQQGQADVGVFPLPGMAGKDLDNVNRWRGQVGQTPVTEDELARISETVPIDGQPAQLYNQAGENPSSGDKTRILAAILRKDGVAWFFKMTGDDSLVQSQKPAFVEFLKSLKFASPAEPALPASHPAIESPSLPAQSAGAGPVATAQTKPRWETPQAWREIAAGQFLVAKFVAAETSGGQATVNVSMSVGDGGGVVGNVNRWRRQIGLGEASAEQVTKDVETVELGGTRTSLIDITGKDASTGNKTRLVAAIVPRSGRTWFYKLMGPEELVAREKDAFTKFIQSAQYPNAS